MPSIGPFQAWIEVDGVRLEEYNVESNEEEQYAECWIASEEGKNFVVGAEAGRRGRTVCSDLYLDGQLCTGRIKPSYSGDRTIVFSSIPFTETEDRLLQFGKVSLTDDDAIAQKDEVLLNQLGTISLVFEIGRCCRNDAITVGRGEILPSQPIHERDKKAADHCIRPGDEEPTIIVFHYRSKDVLQADGIIPPPGPGIVHDHEVNRLPDEADDDEAEKARICQLEEELTARRSALEAKKKRSNERQEEGSTSQRKRVKREDDPPSKLFARGEVIDLT